MPSVPAVRTPGRVAGGASTALVACAVAPGAQQAGGADLVPAEMGTSSFDVFDGRSMGPANTCAAVRTSPEQGEARVSTRRRVRVGTSTGRVRWLGAIGPRTRTDWG